MWFLWDSYFYSFLLFYKNTLEQRGIVVRMAVIKTTAHLIAANRTSPHVGDITITLIAHPVENLKNLVFIHGFLHRVDLVAVTIKNPIIVEVYDYRATTAPDG